MAQHSYRSNGITVDGDNLRFSGDLWGCLNMESSLTETETYFEMEIKELGKPAWCTIGLVPRDYNLNDQPGWILGSTGYRDNGKLSLWRYDSQRRQQQILQSSCYGVGDKVGCGISIVTCSDRPTTRVYFTKNGKEIWSTLIDVDYNCLYPAVLIGPDVEVKMTAWPPEASEQELPRPRDLRTGRAVNSTCYFSPRDLDAVNGDDGFIGRGTFGCVRLAFTEALSAVAVKCVRMAGGDSVMIDHDCEKLMNQVENQQLSSHNNVVRVEGFTFWQGAAGIIMEYVPGGNLATFLFQKSGNEFKISNIPPVIRLRICSDIASGVTFLHHGIASDQRMTHGDLKPENILLTSDLRGKITDFGGSHFATCSSVSMNRERSGRQEFTPCYTAPELLLDRSLRAGRKMDIFSTSMVIRAVLTRKRPNHVGENMMNPTQYERFICEGGRHPQDDIEAYKRSLGNEADVAIIDLLQDEMVRCWNQVPTERPSMMEVRERLLQRLATEDVASIAQHIADVTQQMRIMQPSRQQYNCSPIDSIRF